MDGCLSEIQPDALLPKLHVCIMGYHVKLTSNSSEQQMREIKIQECKTPQYNGPYQQKGIVSVHRLLHVLRSIHPNTCTRAQLQDPIGVLHDTCMPLTHPVTDLFSYCAPGDHSSCVGWFTENKPTITSTLHHWKAHIVPAVIHTETFEDCQLTPLGTCCDSIYRHM